jgi:hypothetical protein
VDRTATVAWSRANRADLRAAVAAAVVEECWPGARGRAGGQGGRGGGGVGIERDCSGRVVAICMELQFRLTRGTRCHGAPVLVSDSFLLGRALAWALR